MNTPDLITCALFTGTAVAASGLAAWTWHGSKAESASTTAVLAWSAAQRAQQTTDGGTPPSGREPAPLTEPAPVRLAAVIDITTRRAA
ncbi:hypothetical protein [Kitasatospora sp. NBC_01302]|uniref:hypothetical protein n=1 Tax=Kitasatospora sp. NBC_01302 TaxID=2903575 RepID=UPI002E12FE9A|nr:hypothetical protein OG294_19640 [Kitasatospora sp. NBC_01302]